MYANSARGKKESRQGPRTDNKGDDLSPPAKGLVTPIGRADTRQVCRAGFSLRRSLWNVERDFEYHFDREGIQRQPPF